MSNDRLRGWVTFPWVTVCLVLLMLVSTIGIVSYFTFRRDIYTDPRVEDVPKLLKVMTPDGPPVFLANISKAIGLQKDLDSFYLEWNRNCYDPAKEAIFRIGKPAIYPLIEIVKDKEEDYLIRMYAGQTIGEFGPDAEYVIPELIKLFISDDLSVSSCASGALYIIGKPAVPPLIACIRDEDNNVRSNSYRLLRGIRIATLNDPVMPVVIEGIIEALKDDSMDIRKDAIINLCPTIFSPGVLKTIPALKLSLNAEDEIVRKLALKILKKIDPDGKG